MESPVSMDISCAVILAWYDANILQRGGRAVLSRTLLIRRKSCGSALQMLIHMRMYICLGDKSIL